MALDETIKEQVRRALLSHQTCAHKDPALCYELVIAEVELLNGRILEDDEIESLRIFMADAILEGLILKGVIETVGLDENGDFLLGLTEAGEEAYREHIKEREEGDG